jgi:hypothetical protein
MGFNLPSWRAGALVFVALVRKVDFQIGCETGAQLLMRTLFRYGEGYDLEGFECRACRVQKPGQDFRNRPSAVRGLS